MIRAIRNGDTFNRQNRTVDYSEGMIRVRLHGNLICWRDDSSVVQFSARGWHTRTTASVLNACAVALNVESRFNRKDGIIHRDGIPLV